MKHKPVSRVALLPLLALVCAAAAEPPMDYGVGQYASVAAWQAGAANVPMDYGLGAYASLEAWAGAATAATTLARR